MLLHAGVLLCPFDEEIDMRRSSVEQRAKRYVQKGHQSADYEVPAKEVKVTIVVSSYREVRVGSRLVKIPAKRT